MMNIDYDMLNRCQRNWSDQRVSEEHKEILFNIANSTPTKQNVNYFKIVAIENQSIQKDIFDIAHSEDDKNKNNYNTQILAPLLFLWCANTDSTFNRINEDSRTHQKLLMEQLHFNAGISAGAVIAVANILGYSSGFCQCFSTKKMYSYLEGQKILSNKANWPVVFLGIGLPNTEFKSNTCINKEQTYDRTRQPLNRPEIIKV